MAKRTPKTASQKRKDKQRRIMKLPKKVVPGDEPVEVTDARLVLKVARRHSLAMAQRGLKEADLAALEQQIELAVAAGRTRLSLEEARQPVKDLLGEYRVAARLACRSLAGLNPVLQETLRMQVGYPDNDEELAGYLTGLDAIVAANSAALAQRGFHKPAQTAFAKAADTFLKARKDLPELRSDRDSAIRERATIFKDLRTMTSYIREMGVAALRHDKARAEFDRVQPAKRPGRKSATAAAAANTAKDGGSAGR
jgi:hypothetical protein